MGYQTSCIPRRVNGQKSNNVYVAESNADGSITVNFSNNEKMKNNINIGPNWNYLFRFYEPKQNLLNGTWIIPKPVPLNSANA